MKFATPKPKKPKTVPYRFIQPESEVGRHLYQLLRDLVDAHHQDVAEARIALAWRIGWEPDVDGRRTLGECKKVSDLDREITDLTTAAYDFVILLNDDFWHDPRVTELQRRALLDHELCHAGVKVDEQGEPVVDERGRVAYRLRKHDLEEFAEIAGRYGCYKRDLEAFAFALDHARVQSGTWVGYTSLQHQLREAGAGVPLDAIVEWSEAERREAQVWATTKRELATTCLPGSTIEVACPEHVQAALDQVPW